MKMCVFSNRIYKDKIDFKTNQSILNTIYSYNAALRVAYSMVIKSELHKVKYEKSLHLELKDKFKYDDYYTNSILREAKGIYKSNIENWKSHIKSKEDTIKNIKNKIATTEKSIKNKETVLNSVIQIYRDIANGKKLSKFKTYKGAKESLVDQTKLIFQVKNHKKTKLFNIYEFEVCYLKPEIKRLKNRLKQLKYSLNRYEYKLSKLKAKPELTCFGSKRFFKTQFTKEEYIKNHNLWKLEFDMKRNKSFQVSGRKDATQGNFIFRYNNKTVTFKDIDGNNISISNVTFPYGQEYLNRALSLTGADRKPVAWEIEDRGEFYIVKAVIELPKKDVNYSKADGIIGLDINYDHFALSNISADGNLIESKVIKFNIKDKTSNQITNILGNAVKDVFKYCKKLNKPLAIEDLDTEDSKAKLRYGNKTKNQILSQFAYSKITNMIEARAYKNSIAVFKRNPAFTSQIGKLKYMKMKGISIHVAAAYVVGRRAMNFKEKLPNCYKKYVSRNILTRHHWAHWRYLSKDLKSVYPNNFYKRINFNNYKTILSVKEFLVAN